MASPPFDAFAPQVAGFLATARTAALATADGDGRPHAANVRFACDERWRFCWVSSERSLHSRNIAARPDAALCIYGHDDAPAQIHGLQVRGLARAASDVEHRHALATYSERYPEIVANAQFAAIMQREAFYVLEPTWMRWIDNRRGFGFKIEWDAP